MIYLSNLKPSPHDPRDWLVKAAPTDLPRSVDLRNYALDIEDQSVTNSCTANAGTTACEMLESRSGVSSGDLSRLFLYWNARASSNLLGQDGGAYMRSIGDALNYYGICQEEDWPFDTSKVNTRPSDEAFQKATKKQLQGYAQITPGDWRTLKEMLAKGFPIVYGMALFEPFLNLRGSLDTHANHFLQNGWDKTKCIGNHAMVIVGYDDDKKYFIVANSWSTSWGDNGYWAMPYGWFEQYAMEAYVFFTFNQTTPDWLWKPEPVVPPAPIQPDPPAPQPVVPEPTPPVPQPDPLAISGPASVTLQRTGISEEVTISLPQKFSVTGGTAPYSWSYVSPSFGFMNETTNAPNVTYRWYKNEVALGWMQAVVTDANGQSVSVIVSVRAEPYAITFDPARATAIREYLKRHFDDLEAVAKDYNVLPGEIDAAMNWPTGMWDRVVQ